MAEGDIVKWVILDVFIKVLVLEDNLGFNSEFRS